MVPIAEDTTQLIRKHNWDGWSWNWPESLFTGSNFHSNRKCSASFKEKEAIKQSYPDVTPMNSDNDQPRNVFLRYNMWCLSVGSNQKLFNWT